MSEIPDFSTILCDFPRLFQTVQNSLLFPSCSWKMLPIFPVGVGTLFLKDDSLSRS